MAEYLPVAHVSDTKGKGVGADSAFGASKTFAIVQQGQGMEVAATLAGLPYEAKNVYRITPLENYAVPPTSSDPSMWNPSHDELRALRPSVVVSEESSFCNRCMTMWCGVGNLRSLNLDFRFTGPTDASYFVERAFQCGGLMCCPLEMYVFGGSRHSARPVGRVKERSSPYCSLVAMLCCKCTTVHDIEVAEESGTFRRIYSLRANLACCGRTSNCCAPSCCFPNAVYDVLDADGNVVSHLQKPFAGRDSCCKAWCRDAFKFSNYILSMPDESLTDDERALLFTGVFQLDYQMFEKKGGDN